MKKASISCLGILMICFSNSASAQKIITEYRYYGIGINEQVDSSIQKMLEPFSDGVAAMMHTIIGFSLNGIFKLQQDNIIGNFICDGLKTMIEKRTQKKIDIAIINKSAVHAFLRKGDISIGMVYEILPYDNQLVTMEIKGKVLRQLLNHVASNNGWPVSGIQMKIKENKAYGISVNQIALEDTASYTMVTSDYLAKGKDGCFMLQEMPVLPTGYYTRNMVIEFIESITKQARTIDMAGDNRIQYVN